VVNWALVLGSAALLAIPGCLNFGPGGSLDHSSSKEDYIAEGKNVGHGKNPNERYSKFKSTGAENIKGLDYEGALQLSHGLAHHPDMKPQVKNGHVVTYCAKGVRYLVNKLFGRPEDAKYYREYSSACSLDEDALNKNGLGASSKKGFRYKSVPLASLHGKLPEASILTCTGSTNPSCSDGGDAGHAEMFIGGRYVSGASELSYPLCLRGGGYTNPKVFILERI
jgi:hypothetical protein